MNLHSFDMKRATDNNGSAHFLLAFYGSQIVASIRNLSSFCCCWEFWVCLFVRLYLLIDWMWQCVRSKSSYFVWCFCMGVAALQVLIRTFWKTLENRLWTRRRVCWAKFPTLYHRQRAFSNRQKILLPAIHWTLPRRQLTRFVSFCLIYMFYCSVFVCEWNFCLNKKKNTNFWVQSLGALYWQLSLRIFVAVVATDNCFAFLSADQ